MIFFEGRNHDRICDSYFVDFNYSSISPVYIAFAIVSDTIVFIYLAVSVIDFAFEMVSDAIVFVYLVVAVSYLAIVFV